VAIIRDDDTANLLTGTSGNDAIFGNGGDDSIYGRGGNDRVLSGAGRDLVAAGAGDDIIEFRASEVDGGETIHGGAGFDTLRLFSSGSVGPVHVNFRYPNLSSIERLHLDSSTNDVTAIFWMSSLSSTLFSPNLEFVGGAGRDTVEFRLDYGGTSLDLRGAIFTNWDAEDRLIIYAGSDATVNGTGQADEIWFDGSLARGNAGDDRFIDPVGAGLSTTINGGAGNDCLILTQATGFLPWLVGVEEVHFAETSGSAQQIDIYTDAFDIGAASPHLRFVDVTGVRSVVKFMMWPGGDLHFNALAFTFADWDADDWVMIGGGTSDDTIIGSIVNDDIEGGEGDDRLLGQLGDDLIIGDVGNDTIGGGDGSDWIFGNVGADSVNGGAGNDTFEFRAALDVGGVETIHGGSGFDTLLLSSEGSLAGAGPIQLAFENPDISSIECLQFNSSLNDIAAEFLFDRPVEIGFSSHLEFVGGSGKDSVDFNLGDGNLSLDLRGATFTNWSAEDRVEIHSSDYYCTVNGTGQADEIWLGLLGNHVNGNGGDDLFVVDIGVSQATIDGGSGWDSLVIRGSAVVDDLNRFRSIEEIRFESTGIGGRDFYFMTLWSDAFDLGFANPFFHFTDADAVKQTVQVFMSDADTYFSAAGFTFENWSVENRVLVLGSVNNDKIIGSTVGDYLIGSGGLDVLVGGMGNDTFAFESIDSGIGQGNRDRILDFAGGDLIDLSYMDANASLVGDQAFVLDTDNILTEGEIRLRGNLNTLVQLNLDANTDVDMEIVLCGVAPGSIAADDFIL
jgi:Ca2+-binding RTX toxin-like protein